ncbi:MAG: VPLPA-CTERM sorting domain-containing protein [Gemmatimonadota bacterium]|nr:VPLPA-CTERM sorting domain-containing protein [Gemmatimonadota bacterium]
MLAPTGNVLVVVNKVTPNDVNTFSFETSFVPTAVPEPASVVLLATGLAAMAVVTGRRRRAMLG